MFNFHKLISKDYLFTVNRVILTRSDKLFFIIGILLIVLAIALKIASIYALNPVDRVLRHRFYRLFLIIGILEVIWFGLRYENAPLFGSHFLALLIALIGLICFVKLVVSAVMNYKSDKTMWDKEQIKLKYLPK